MRMERVTFFREASKRRSLSSKPAIATVRNSKNSVGMSFPNQLLRNTAIDGRGDVVTIDWALRDFPWAAIVNVVASYLNRAETFETIDEAAFRNLCFDLENELEKRTFTHRIRFYLPFVSLENDFELPNSVAVRILTNREREDFYNWCRESGAMVGNAHDVAEVGVVIEHEFELPRGRSQGFFDINPDQYQLALRLASEHPVSVLVGTQLTKALVYSALEIQIGRPNAIVRRSANTFSTTAANLASDILSLLKGNATAAKTAISRLQFASDRERLEDRFLDLVVGLESIVNGDEKGEVTFKFRQRLAALIGTDAEERVEIFKSAGKIYAARSSVAHGTASAAKGLENLTAAADRFLRRAIVTILETPRYSSIANLDDDVLKGTCQFVSADTTPLSFRLTRTIA